MDSQAAKVSEAWALKQRTEAGEDTSRLPSLSTAGDFEVGQQVTIVGLVSRPELNGCFGQIQSSNETKGRFAVALALGSVNVKASNIALTMADMVALSSDNRQTSWTTHHLSRMNIPTKGIEDSQ